MYWETLPGWFWVIYYGFLGATFLTAIVRIGRRKKLVMEVPVLLLVFALPVVGFLFSGDAGRPLEQNEFEFFLSQLQQGAFWTIFSIAGYSLVLLWWVSVFKKRLAV